MSDHSTAITSPPVMTVQGLVPYEHLGITDAHNHVWIDPIPGADPGSPVLNQFDLILTELVEFRDRGGECILDCQPGGCGRDGNKLLELSRASGVNLVACTGFHRKKYYHPDHWLQQANAGKVYDFLCSELEQGSVETLDTPSPVRAGFIKVALEAAWVDCPHGALEGAAQAARKTGVLVEIHTEKGALAERACLYFADMGVAPHQLVLCHMDKRPDLGLHQALARFGVLLEYDTFYRSKYHPEANLWPLLEQMVACGCSDRIALATDMAEAELYRAIGGGPGLASLPGEIREMLQAKGIADAAQKQLLGANIARRLAGLL
jgi:5-phospho-D-xylono-1,4-lactonase